MCFDVAVKCDDERRVPTARWWRRGSRRRTWKEGAFGSGVALGIDVGDDVWESGRRKWCRGRDDSGRDGIDVDVDVDGDGGRDETKEERTMTMAMSTLCYGRCKLAMVLKKKQRNSVRKTVSRLFGRQVGRV